MPLIAGMLSSPGPVRASTPHAPRAYARALELGAQPVEIPTGPMELRLPAIKGIGGAPIYLIEIGRAHV